MSLLLYGIVAETALPVNFEASLLLISAEGLTAVAASCEQANSDIETVLAFGKLVELIHHHTTIIPIRYGSLLPDESSVIELLAENSKHYRKLLAELDDCEEMGIRLPMMATLGPEALPVKKASSGLGYLQALKNKYSATEQAEKQATALDQALAGLYRKRGAEAGLFSGQSMYLVSYLVPRSQLAAFKEKLDGLDEEETHTRIISGPWPPYNFAG